MFNIKRDFTFLLAGLFIITGTAGLTAGYAAPSSPASAVSRDIHESHGKPPQHEVMNQKTPEQIAQNISDTFGVDKAEVLTLIQQKKPIKEIGHAALLAKASNQSLSQVMSAKNPDNTWKDVATTLGITKEKIQTARREIMAVQLEKRSSVPQSISLPLLSQGYKPHDIATASRLSQHSSHSLADILALKKINNTWQDVAKELGIDPAFATPPPNLRSHHSVHPDQAAAPLLQ